MSGGAGLKNGKLGDVDVKFAARNVHFRYGDGPVIIPAMDLHIPAGQQPKGKIVLSRLKAVSVTDGPGLWDAEGVEYLGLELLFQRCQQQRELPQYPTVPDRHVTSPVSHWVNRSDTLAAIPFRNMGRDWYARV